MLTEHRLSTRRHYGIALLILAAISLLSASAAQAELDILAITGRQAEGTGKTFDTVGYPVLNEAGQAAFSATLDPFEGVLYRATRYGGVPIVSSEGVPNGLTHELGFGDEPAINGRGQVAFLGIFDDKGTDAEGIYRGDGATVVELARTGMQAGDAVTDTYAGQFSLPLFNDAGEVGFRAVLEGPDSHTGIYRAAESEAWQIARTGQGGLDQVDKPTGMNNRGSVVFTAHLAGENFDSLYRSSGAFTDLGDPLFPTEAQVGTPGAQVVEIRLDEDADPMIGRRGQVVFNSLTSTLETVPDFPSGAFLVNDLGGLQTLAINEEGSPWQTIGVEAINERGQILLRGNKADTMSGGYYLLDSRGPGIRAIFDRNNPPEGAEFTVVEGVALGDGGHFALLTQPAFDEGPSGQNALYAIDTLSVAYANGEPVGTLDVHEVARTGHALMGSEIVDLRFAKDRHQWHERGLRQSPAIAANERAGVNERGQVAFWFELADGREGVALWSPPRLERVIDGDFDVGFFHWEITGLGSASVVELTPGEWVGELLAGSSVTIAQTVSTPETAFDLGFDLKFLSGEGALDVALDGEVLETLEASEFGAMEAFEFRSLRLDGPTGLSDADLSFTFDGPDGAGVQLDNVSLRAIPEPATVGILAVGMLALVRKRRY